MTKSKFVSVNLPQTHPVLVSKNFVLFNPDAL